MENKGARSQKPEARMAQPFFWRYMKRQDCAEIPAMVRYCWEVAPEVFVAVRVVGN